MFNLRPACQVQSWNLTVQSLSFSLHFVGSRTVGGSENPWVPSCKVHRNLHPTFDCMYCSQKKIFFSPNVVAFSGEYMSFNVVVIICPLLEIWLTDMSKSGGEGAWHHRLKQAWKEVEMAGTGRSRLAEMYHRVYVQVVIYKINVKFFHYSHKLTCVLFRNCQSSNQNWTQLVQHIKLLNNLCEKLQNSANNQTYYYGLTGETMHRSH